MDWIKYSWILNVVDATLNEKEYNEAFSEKHFVLEDCCIDARKVIVNEVGQVFLIQYDRITLLCETIEEYLDLCIKDNT